MAGEDRYGTFVPEDVPIYSKQGQKIWRRRLTWFFAIAVCFCGFVFVVVQVSSYFLKSWGSSNKSMLPSSTQLFPTDMTRLMDQSVSPCSDFYEYACGTFINNHKLKPDQLEFAHAWDGVERNNTKRLLPIIAHSDSNAGVFYRSCMNTSAINSLGISPLKPFIKQVEAVKDLVSLTVVVYWWHKANVVVFYDWSVESNPDKPEESALYLMQGGITFPSPNFYISSEPSMKLKREGYKRVATDVLSKVCKIMTNCDVATWPKVAAERSLEVETALAERFASAQEQRVERAQPYDIQELEKLCPALHLKRFINAMAGTYHSQADTIADKITIMIRNSPYFESMNKYLVKADLDSIKAYLLFRLAFVLGADMDKEMEDTGFMLQRIVTGQVKKVPRWKKCMHAAINALPDDVGKLFVNNFFSTKRKMAAEHMLMRLKLAFKEDLLRVDWMQNSTKQAALEKLHVMFFAIGRPSYWNYYNGVYLMDDKYLWNGLQLSEWYIKHSFKRLTRKTDPHRWGSTSPTMVDAFYSYTANGLYVPAGILQEPFFSASFPLPRNFGALGGILGHEITHGFDDQGRKFGGRGTLSNWWTVADSRRFEEKARCIEHFYSSFEVDGRHVNGLLTLGENIADMGGVKISYEALQSVMQEKFHRKSTKDEDKLFFLSWAQNWCTVERRKAEELQLLTDEHSPNKLRVNGPLMNFESFAEAYSCPAGSYMNPRQRCEMW